MRFLAVPPNEFAAQHKILEDCEWATGIRYMRTGIMIQETLTQSQFHPITTTKGVVETTRLSLGPGLSSSPATTTVGTGVASSSTGAFS